MKKCLHSRWNFLSLREKCPNTEFFLVRIFPQSDWIRSISPYSVRMRENTDQKNLCIWTFFMQCVFALLMLFMNRFCCRLWTSRLTNIFTLMKIFLIFKGNMQKSDIGRQIKFHEIRNLWDFGLQKYCPRKFPGRH